MTDDQSKAIREFLLDSRWLKTVGEVSFLAAGEYNENYLVISDDLTFVFRINRGSQLDLDDQISYEFQVLKAVERSSRTPIPYHCHPADSIFPGSLLMSFIPGSRFSYESDSLLAASTLARIHLIPSDTHNVTLISQPNAVRSIIAESLGMIGKQPDHPMDQVKRTLLQYADEMNRYEEIFTKADADSRHCIVNTELNSGNFIVSDNVAFLVDWEKAVISSRYQDLAHFLVPTTTLWKTDYRYNETSRHEFLLKYAAESEMSADIEELSEMTAIMERVILLRAMSWCYMAYYEYTKTTRALANEKTFSRIKMYLDEIRWFLR